MIRYKVATHSYAEMSNEVFQSRNDKVQAQSIYKEKDIEKSFNPVMIRYKRGGIQIYLTRPAAESFNPVMIRYKQPRKNQRQKIFSKVSIP